MMNGTFSRAFEEMMRHDGGYVNDPNDPNGETRYGLSKRNYPQLDLLHLSIDKAREIYQRDHWRRLRLDEVRNEDVASELFCQSVNFGPQIAIAHCQRALNFLGRKVMIDGVMGRDLTGTVNSYPDQRALLRVLVGLQFMQYVKMADGNSKVRFKVKGWLKKITLGQ